MSGRGCPIRPPTPDSAPSGGGRPEHISRTQDGWCDGSLNLAVAPSPGGMDAAGERG
jgi:hypothetical protein